MIETDNNDGTTAGIATSLVESTAPAAIPAGMSNSTPMASLPLNSSSKLDQEPNPFEQSFSGATVTLSDDNKASQQPETPNKPVLPPVAAITSPAVHPLLGGGRVLPKEVANQFAWDSLRTGPLSPSMLQGPANPDDYNGYNGGHLKKPATSSHLSQGISSAAFINQISEPTAAHPYQTKEMYVQPSPIKVENDPTQNMDMYMHTMTTQQTKPVETQRSGSLSSATSQHDTTATASRRTASQKNNAPAKDNESSNKRKRMTSKEKTPEDDEKRKNFLERNRIAALKCRQRKKQWLNNLQSKVEYLSNDNERLQMQTEALREEIVNLKTLLLAHKDCPVAQANGFHPAAVQKPMPAMMMRPQYPQQPPPGYPANNQMLPSRSPTSSTHVTSMGPPASQFPHTNMVNMPPHPQSQLPQRHPLPAPASHQQPQPQQPQRQQRQSPHHSSSSVPPPPHQHSMMAGGASSGMLRF
ncbi:uncharacterized protein BYT42DRAFT_570520 [Radiomyces spectabilis]|uniref:uncharacterized protein n=1 Tax=Radiomyces spectabilis TaxID=64574 RepID=UPI002220854F|nr:uncharacterized protein BYT42DRAFT_570520 [Radiomyces spectabilis]KAI8377500.1 hypothetical protein BYT42DRAFT_570520 [Radiomyces spectabilis]